MKKWQEERNYRRIYNEAGEVIANIITVDGVDVEVAEDVYLAYTADDGDGGTMLCATVSDLTEQMRQVLWRPEHAFVLASGTLAVGDDFHRFRSQAGLMDGQRVTESVSLSPFDYKRNCLLYLPQLPPSQSSEAYYDEEGGKMLHGSF